MLTKQQYESLTPYKPILDMFKKTGSNVGGYDGLVPIYESILGTHVNRNCNSCVAGMFVDSLNMMESYERDL